MKMKMKMMYEPPVAQICRVSLEGMIAVSTPHVSAGVECREEIVLGDDGFGNNDILLNF